MMKNSRETKYLLAVCVLAFGCMLFYPSFTGAQNLTHTVEKGDTLWSICEKYYGDTDLWPKLWQMNSFITNPHFLHPGDVITLLEGEAFKTSDTQPEGPEKVTPEMTGIDVSGMVPVGGIGFLSLNKLKPWGHIFSSYTSTKLMLGDGDKIVVNFQDDRQIKAGDKFTVCQSSSLLRHPITDNDLGYSIAVHGYLILKKHLKKTYYEAEILDAFSPINVNDMVIPYEPVSSCIQPLSAGSELMANIVATREQKELIGQYSIVYIDQGFNQGVRRGHLFHIIRIKKIDDSEFKGKNFTETVKELSKTTSLEDIYKKYTRKMSLYEFPIGTVLILESRPHTSTALVLSAKENFGKGAFMKSLSWEEAPEMILKMERCVIE